MFATKTISSIIIRFLLKTFLFMWCIPLDLGLRFIHIAASAVKRDNDCSEERQWSFLGGLIWFYNPTNFQDDLRIRYSGRLSYISNKTQEYFFLSNSYWWYAPALAFLPLTSHVLFGVLASAAAHDQTQCAGPCNKTAMPAHRSRDAA